MLSSLVRYLFSEAFVIDRVAETPTMYKRKTLLTKLTTKQGGGGKKK